jgi:hypothetical protein
MPGAVHYLAQTEGNNEESQSAESVSREFQNKHVLRTS